MKEGCLYTIIIVVYFGILSELIYPYFDWYGVVIAIIITILILYVWDRKKRIKTGLYLANENKIELECEYCEKFCGKCEISNEKKDYSDIPITLYGWKSGKYVVYTWGCKFCDTMYCPSRHYIENDLSHKIYDLTKRNGHGVGWSDSKDTLKYAVWYDDILNGTKERIDKIKF